MDETNIDQRWLVFIAVNLGYTSLANGMCKGLAMMARKNFLLDMMGKKNFLPPVFTFSMYIDAFYNLTNQNIFDINNYPGLTYVALRNGRVVTVRYLLDFLDAVKIYQINQDADDLQLEILITQEISARYRETLLTSAPTLCVFRAPYAFNEAGLEYFLKGLKENLTVPVALILSSSNHTVNLNLAAKQWFFMDANNLSPWRNSEKSLAQRLIAALNLSDKAQNAVFDCQIYVDPNHQVDWKNDLEALNKTAPWQVSKTIDSQKRAIRDVRNSSLMHIAMENGHISIVEKCLAAGSSVNEVGVDGLPLISLAVRAGNLAFVETLISKDADVNQTDSYGMTPLCAAIMFDHIALVRLLIQKGAAIEKGIFQSTTPLHVAVERKNYDIAKELLENWADVNAKTALGVTPLHIAVANGDIEMVELLLAFYVQVNAVDKDGNTPLMLLCANPYLSEQNSELFYILLEQGADLSIQNKIGQTAEDIARHAENIEFQRALIEFRYARKHKRKCPERSEAIKCASQNYIFHHVWEKFRFPELKPIEKPLKPNTEQTEEDVTAAAQSISFRERKRPKPSRPEVTKGVRFFLPAENTPLLSPMGSFISDLGLSDLDDLSAPFQ